MFIAVVLFRKVYSAVVLKMIHVHVCAKNSFYNYYPGPNFVKLLEVVKFARCLYSRSKGK